MNERDPQTREDLAPLDTFESQWIEALAERDPELKKSEDAFVDAVIQQAASAQVSSHASAVLARIGTAALPYAVAAAVMLAVLVGWSILQGGTVQTPDRPPMAEQPANTLQPDDAPAVTQAERPNIRLGKLIANAKSAATMPANNLTATVSETPDHLSIDRLFDLVGESLPDLNDILKTQEPDEQQSRA
jgi:negative regulator of sigma E activity